MMVKFTVATVCYNAANTIEETILSVVNQTYDNVEYVIVDGGSTDSTLDIVHKYEGKRIKLISEPDNGVYDAMNKALKIATGDFLIFLGADDHFISFDILSKISILTIDKQIIYYGNVLRPQRNDIFCGYYNKWKFAVKNLPHQAIFYPQSVYKNYSYDLRYKVYADYVYNLNLFKNYKFRYLPLTVSFFNDNGMSSSVKDKFFEMDYGRLTKKNLGVLPNIYATCYHFFRDLLNR